MQITTWKVRNEKQVSLRKLQELTGISKSTLNNIDNGRTCPTVEQIERIAIALDVKISDLIESDYL